MLLFSKISVAYYGDLRITLNVKSFFIISKIVVLITVFLYLYHFIFRGHLGFDSTKFEKILLCYREFLNDTEL